jgi:hypothetical protein
MGMVGVALVGCSAGNDATTGAGGTGGANPATTGAGGGFTTSSAGGSGSGGMDGCEGIYEAASLKDLHLYVMVDASVSMAGNKWAAAQEGLSAFVNAPASAGIDVAVSFFPRPPDGVPACEQTAYKTPKVPYGLLPGNAQAVVDAMAAEVPDGFNSPMYPALGGAMLASIELAQTKPDDAVAVLLVTDGKPDGPALTCSGVDPSDPQSLADLAAVGAAFDPPVATFVVGLPGVDATFANLVAAAGGTGEALFVSTTNTAAKFAEALEKARGAALACQYDLPVGVLDGSVSKSLVNVEVKAGNGTTSVVSYNEGCTAAGGGWTFDDPVDPSSIALCPETCGAIATDFDASIAIVLGCPTVK